jgi:hypothetical protein
VVIKISNLYEYRKSCTVFHAILQCQTKKIGLVIVKNVSCKIKNKTISIGGLLGLKTCLKRNMKMIHAVCCRELCNLLPTVYRNSRTQVSLAPTSTCYVKYLNIRKVLNCIFRSKVKWWLQIILSYRPCFRTMEIQATQHLHSTGTNSSHAIMYSERLDNINMHFHSYLFNYT